MLQDQFKHLSCAPNQSNTNAVQHHPFAAVKHSRGQVLWFYFTDELPKASCHCFFRDWLLQNCTVKEVKKGQGYVKVHKNSSTVEFTKIDILSTADLCSPLTANIGLMVFCRHRVQNIFTRKATQVVSFSFFHI